MLLVSTTGKSRCHLRHPGAVRSYDHWFEPCPKAAGISNLNWHDLRHTFASWLIQSGVPRERVSKLLAHRKITMTMRYAHLGPKQLHADFTLLVPTPVPETISPSLAQAGTAFVN